VRLLAKLPVFGTLLIEKSVVLAGRTLSTMFAAVFHWSKRSTRWAAHRKFISQTPPRKFSGVSTGTSLTAAMTNANLFPTMVLQMCAIGEESGSLNHMLGKDCHFLRSRS
jgi:type IV pilus assembly protein PilC